MKRRTKGSGEIQIHRPAVSILAAAKPRWFIENVRAEDIEGGFLSRWLLIAAEENNGNGAFFGNGYNTGAAAEAQRQSLVDHLRNLSTYEGRMRPGEGGDVLEAWLKKWDALGWDEDNDPADLASRAGTHIVKLTMGLQACRGTDMLEELHPKAVEVAIGMWEYAHKSAQPLVARMQMSGAGGREGTELERVRRAIRSAGSITYSTLLRKLQVINAAKMEGYVATLKLSNEIDEEPVKTGGRTGRRLFWRP